MSPAQHAANQLGRLGRRRFHVAQPNRLRQQGEILGVFQPLAPCALADIHSQQRLHRPVAHRAGHPAQAGGVLVGVVYGEAVQLQKAEQVIDPAAVLPFVGRVDAHDGVHAFPGRIHQRGDGQLVFPVDALLFFFGQFVRFNERVPVGRHVTVGLAPAVQRIDADPCAAAGLVGPDDRVDVVFFAQAGDELRRLHGQVGIDGPELAVAVGRRLRDEPDQVAGAEQRLQIANQHLAGRKFHSILKIGEGGDPAVLSRHGADGAQGHGML